MAAPIRKVAPNGWGIGPLIGDAIAAAESLSELARPTIHDSLSAFGVVISSTGPQSLHRATAARVNIRRLAALR